MSRGCRERDTANPKRQTKRNAQWEAKLERSRRAEIDEEQRDIMPRPEMPASATTEGAFGSARKRADVAERVCGRQSPGARLRRRARKERMKCLVAKKLGIGWALGPP